MIVNKKTVWRIMHDMGLSRPKIWHKPASKFPEPDEGNYFYWRFNASRYTETDTNPGSLSDFFTDGAYYWVEITHQD